MGSALLLLSVGACGGRTVRPHASDSGTDAAQDAGPDAGDAACEPVEPDRVRFAVIGDFGEASDREADVAGVVADWAPDFVATTGDNNYVYGGAETIDENVGQYYSAWIHPYGGAFGEGACENRFFPALGNADWDVTSAEMDLPEPYLDYFSLPENERYYEVRKGPVHLFVLDADPREPDGVLWTSAQGAWLESALASSTAPFRVVTMHHSPLASGDERGPQGHMQWPFRSWGASVVLSGHDHLYERLHHDGLWHLVDGLGGRERTDGLLEPMAGSETFFSDDYGAVLADADPGALRMRFVTRGGVQIDEVRIPAADVHLDESLVPEGSEWRYLADGTSPGRRWERPGFDDSSWPSGPGQLGAGEDDEVTVLPDADVSTAYFRTSFDVADPARFQSLELRVLCDDGAIAFLNGVEVLRSNLPVVAPASGPDEDRFASAAVDPALLTTGPNVLAVKVDAATPTGSDVSFEAVLSGRVATSIVPGGSVFRWLDDGSDPGDSWRETDFDDSAWPSGASPLGYGDADLATAVAPVTTVYFRSAFDWAGAPPAMLWLRLQKDDAAIVYLNGHEVYRGGLPTGPIGPETRAPFPLLGPMESAFVETSIDPALLEPGPNVLAVEVHGALEPIEDLAFDVELLETP